MSNQPEIIGAYADGGIVGRNPSAIGGTWAWCHVDAAGNRVLTGSGRVKPCEVFVDLVTNNQTELIAAIRCLEALPAGWAGTFHTDSQVTLYRVTRPRAKFNNIPMFLKLELRRAKDRLGKFGAVLLGGHPTREELAAGRRRDGWPVSEHNVWADAECNRQAALMKAGAA